MHSGDQNRVGLKNSTVQKSYNRSGKLGILGLLGIRKINNLRIINTPCKTDPDQVHHFFNSLRTSTVFNRLLGDGLFSSPDLGSGPFRSLRYTPGKCAQPTHHFMGSNLDVLPRTTVFHQPPSL